MTKKSIIPVATLGTPRIGSRRELKFALERYWAGQSDAKTLQQEAAALRRSIWTRQHQAGVDIVPSNDFSLYDHILDTSVTVGAVPPVYDWKGGYVSLPTYFAMARGDAQEESCCGKVVSSGIPALEMTKWFDTNYHYLVPELSAEQEFTLTSTKVLDEFREAQAQGIPSRPVLVGPVTFLKLSKATTTDFDPLSLLGRLLPVYSEILQKLSALGAEWVQIDEPVLVLDLDDKDRSALTLAYETFARDVPDLEIMLATYFGALGDNLETAVSLPISGLHLDLVRAPEQLSHVISKAREDLILSLGVIDGRNVWRADLQGLYDWLAPIVAERGRETFQIAPSCSLLHMPVDIDLETDLDPELKSWLAFAYQKFEELKALSTALGEGIGFVTEVLEVATRAVRARAQSGKIHNEEVAASVSAINARMARRYSTFAVRRQAQKAALNLPAFPTTTIGSFPQTKDVRKARAAYGRGDMSRSDYEAFLKAETKTAIEVQEDIGIDVLVHGEFERNDMVQYFGEKMAGYAFTKHGWVQSYGSRYVRPPIIFGDVSRPEPMTVHWSSYAQSLTDKPVKGMLTGPVTMLQWSFVRDDIPRETICKQIALALRSEVTDLEAAGIGLIQIDEPALREGLPLRQSEWADYLDWAVACFRITASGVQDETQIHTHMCYCEFNDIMYGIAALDADVISIETSRSKMELLDAFVTGGYPNEIGPGVYDIHSPRVPSVDEMKALLRTASSRLAPDQIWVNPDCGLKTRSWEEVTPALRHMVAAAKSLRTETL
ncbi:5-methyltetrahydropteroyltriglutamate--homocysteine S-methyltransferase [Kordiimonas sediminis]|nr:5-methyltetrahydropteroyltriglutamate--homocysteine S-methyltransferase [Kordiimonas sediminis]